MKIGNYAWPCFAFVFALGTLAGAPAVTRGAGEQTEVTEANVAYGEAPEQCLDLSFPNSKGFPTVIFVHGGGLVGGDKADQDYRDVCRPFVEAGIACANVNYRLGPASAWPAQPEDVADAVAWVHRSIGARGGDPEGIFLMGHSSGALLVALVGTDSTFFARCGLESADVRGVIPMGSIMEDVELQETLKDLGRETVERGFARDPSNAMYGGLDTYLGLWPMHHVRRRQAPFLFLIAEAERVQPPVLATNEKFVVAARALGNEARIEILAGRTHGTAIRRLGEPGDPAFTHILDFVHQHTKDGHR